MGAERAQASNAHQLAPELEVAQLELHWAFPDQQSISKLSLNLVPVEVEVHAFPEVLRLLCGPDHYGQYVSLRVKVEQLTSQHSWRSPLAHRSEQFVLVILRDFELHRPSGERNVNGLENSVVALNQSLKQADGAQSPRIHRAVATGASIRKRKEDGRRLAQGRCTFPCSAEINFAVCVEKRVSLALVKILHQRQRRIKRCAKAIEQSRSIRDALGDLSVTQQFCFIPCQFPAPQGFEHRRDPRQDVRGQSNVWQSLGFLQDRRYNWASLPNRLRGKFQLEGMHRDGRSHPPKRLLHRRYGGGLHHGFLHGVPEVLTQTRSNSGFVLIREELADKTTR
mmetsp:Transcript_18684/g.40527  ORF Transcript_18684/g.40527 Transcript_18684/m.40527 type:complete len:338 (+) Transcript_18684:658-1671(+)